MAPTAKTASTKKTTARTSTTKTSNAKPAKKTATRAGSGDDRDSASSFTAEERAAMKDRAAELKAKRSGKGKIDGATDLQEKIAAMPEEDREVASAVHDVIMAAAPDLEQKTWYGMPAYAKDGQTICFFQNAGKFKARYSMLGFSDRAALDDGDMWPVYYAIPAMTPALKKTLTTLIKKAVG